MILKFHVLLAVIAFYNIKHFFILFESIYLQKKGNGGLSTFNLFTNQNFSHISLQAQWKVCGW